MAEEGTTPAGAEGAADKTIASAAPEGAADKQTSEAKTIATEGDGKTEDQSKDAKGDKDKASGAPEKYEAFKLPEGVTVDEAAMGEFQTIAKELNLPQEAAQKLVDLQSKLVQQMAQGQADAWNALATEWKDAAKNDKEFGGAAFEANVGAARKSIDLIFPDKAEAAAFRTMLDTTGIGNNPEFLRYAVRVGKLMGDDKIHRGQAPGSNEKVRPEVALYPTMREQTAS